MTQTDFFKFNNYREFLKRRYDLLKSTRRGFSARTFCRLAKVSSPSYFRLVVEGKRKLSADYARRFAEGLKLNRFETNCLVTAVLVELTTLESERQRLLQVLRKLKEQTLSENNMTHEHVQILAVPWMLKLYLLPQHVNFKLGDPWLAKQFEGIVSEKDLTAGVQLMFDSKLWVETAGGKVTTCAPVMKTGDCLTTSYLAESHKNYLDAAKEAVATQTSSQRVLGGRTFLFDRARLAEVSAKINAFKQEMESEFECLQSPHVYQLHLSFFEIAPALTSKKGMPA